MTDYILKDWDGNIFISMTNEDESTLSQYEQLTHCLVVVKVGEDYPNIVIYCKKQRKDNHNG